MKTTSNQVRRNGATKPAKAQRKTRWIKLKPDSSLRKDQARRQANPVFPSADDYQFLGADEKAKQDLAKLVNKILADVFAKATAPGSQMVYGEIVKAVYGPIQKLEQVAKYSSLGLGDSEAYYAIAQFWGRNFDPDIYDLMRYPHQILDPEPVGLKAFAMMPKNLPRAFAVPNGKGWFDLKRGLLKPSPTPAKADHVDARTELEDAQSQSNALAVLLADFYDYQVSNGFLVQGEADKISAGIGQLVRVTKQRLEAAVDQSLAIMTGATN